MRKARIGRGHGLIVEAAGKGGRGKEARGGGNGRKGEGNCTLSGHSCLLSFRLPPSALLPRRFHEVDDPLGQRLNGLQLGRGRGLAILGDEVAAALMSTASLGTFSGGPSRMTSPRRLTQRTLTTRSYSYFAGIALAGFRSASASCSLVMRPMSTLSALASRTT